MTKPPLNQLIEWDGSYDRPVPKGSCVTILRNDGSYLKTTNPYLDWTGVTAYLVHAYPPEDDVVDYEVTCFSDGDVRTTYVPHGECRPVAVLTIRFTNGIAEIVSQEKA